MHTKSTVAIVVVVAVALSISGFAVASHDPRASQVFAGNGRPLVGDSSHDDVGSSRTGIVGNVSISNISPACSDTGTVPSTSTTTQVVVTSESGKEAFIPVSWYVVGTCLLFGTFQAGLSPGTYSLTLSYCLGSPPGQYYPPGCPNAACGLQSCNLPVTVTVDPGKLTPVSIGITTGIY